MANPLIALLSARTESEFNPEIEALHGLLMFPHLNPDESRPPEPYAWCGGCAGWGTTCASGIWEAQTIACHTCRGSGVTNVKTGAHV